MRIEISTLFIYCRSVLLAFQAQSTEIDNAASYSLHFCTRWQFPFKHVQASFNSEELSKMLCQVLFETNQSILTICFYLHS